MMCITEIARLKIGRTSIVVLILNPLSSQRTQLGVVRVRAVEEVLVSHTVHCHFAVDIEYGLRQVLHQVLHELLLSPLEHRLISPTVVGTDFVLRLRVVCWHHQCSTSTTNDREVTPSPAMKRVSVQCLGHQNLRGMGGGKKKNTL